MTVKIPHGDFGGHASWADWIKTIEARKGHKICGAHVKQTEVPRPCEVPPMPNGKCYSHGGKTPGPGPGHPAYKHGRTSRALPPKMAARVEEALRDPELLSLRYHMALNWLRYDQLQGALTGGAGRDAWQEAQEEWEGLRKAAADKNGEAANAHMKRLGELLNAGVNEAEVWNDLFALQDQFRKLSSSETRRLVSLDQLATIEQITAMFGAIEIAAIRCVPIPAYREAFGRELIRIFRGENGPEPLAIGGSVGG